MHQTLAYRMRPQHLDDILGQQHLVGDNKIFNQFVKTKHPMSMILYGSPGCGKTTLAMCLANDLDIPYRLFNASTGNKKEMDTIIEEAKLYDGMFVIIDEVHRLNKDKQDHLLPHIESGLLVIVGCTTANPYHSINPAIRSRCHLFEVKPLTQEDILDGLQRALIKEKYTADLQLLKVIAHYANGDIRYALNCLELCMITCDNRHLTIDLIEKCSFKMNTKYDKDEGEYYDTLSGLQKSIRGSDPNGALYYFAKLIEYDDIPSLERRLLVTAYEDIGLANPMACARTVNAIDVAKRVGFPEARIPLAVAIIDLALSPKSKSAESAIDKALACLNQTHLSAPNYLRLSPVGLADDEKYDYSRSDLWEYFQYLPLGLEKEIFYIPNTTSSYEKNLTTYYEKILKHGRTSDIKRLNHTKPKKENKN